MLKIKISHKFRSKKMINWLTSLVVKPTDLNAPGLDPNTLKGRDRPLYVKKVLMDLGWKDYQAAAMVGQFMQESYTDLRSSVWGDKHTAFGIAQWRGNRLADLERFATALVKPIGDLDTQARFVNWELTKGSEKNLGDRLRKTNNINDALLIAIGYERPRGYSALYPEKGDGYDNRCRYAKSLM